MINEIALPISDVFSYDRIMVRDMKHVYVRESNTRLLVRYMETFKDTSLKSLFLKLNPPSGELYIYCAYVSDDRDVWMQLVYANDSKADYHRYLYCLYVKDREEIWRTLTRDNADPFAQVSYCASVKDREEIWRALARSTHPDAEYWRKFYCRDVRDRREMRL